MHSDPLKRTLFLRDSTINGDCSLSGASLSGGIELSGSRIRGNIILDNVNILNGIYFDNLKIDGYIRTNIPWIAVLFHYFKQGINIDKAAAQALVPNSN